MTNTLPTQPPIILFDGVCNLCAWSVQFIIKHDPRGAFKFAALQSPAGQTLLAARGLAQEHFDSVVLIEGDRFYKESSAALRIARRLSGLWPLLYGFMIVPTFIRDWVYQFIATHRYGWFGKTDSCLMPTPDLNSRFLSESNIRVGGS